MAEVKRKKAPVKIFDVSRPGRSAPSTTAKPVIVSNRPVLQDPMVVKPLSGDISSDDAAKTAENTSPTSMSHKIVLQPLTIGIKDDTEAAPGAPAMASAEIDQAIKLTEKHEEKAKEAEPADAAEPAEEPIAEPLKDEKPDEPKTEAKPEPEPEAEPVVEESPKAEPAEEEPVKEEKTKPADEPDDKPVKDEEVTDTAPGTEPKDDDEPGEIPLGEEVAGGDEKPEGGLSEAEQKELQAAKKLAEQQEKVIAAGTYYLPIGAVQKRRVHRHVVLGIVLIVVLAVVLFLAAWDVGLFSIPGYSSPTNFF